MVSLVTDSITTLLSHLNTSLPRSWPNSQLKSAHGLHLPQIYRTPNRHCTYPNPLSQASMMIPSPNSTRNHHLQLLPLHSLRLSCSQQQLLVVNLGYCGRRTPSRLQGQRQADGAVRLITTATWITLPLLCFSTLQISPHIFSYQHMLPTFRIPAMNNPPKIPVHPFIPIVITCLLLDYTLGAAHNQNHVPNTISIYRPPFLPKIGLYHHPSLFSSASYACHDPNCTFFPFALQTLACIPDTSFSVYDYYIFYRIWSWGSRRRWR